MHRTPRRPSVPATIELAVAIAAVWLSWACCGATLRDLEYAVVDGISLKLGLYLPNAPPGQPRASRRVDPRRPRG
jgi:hypothetical protein